MSSICAKLREARELAEDGSPEAEALDAIIARFCDNGTVSPNGSTGGGPNGPPG